MSDPVVTGLRIHQGYCKGPQPKPREICYPAMSQRDLSGPFARKTTETLKGDQGLSESGVGHAMAKQDFVSKIEIAFKEENCTQVVHMDNPAFFCRMT